MGRDIGIVIDEGDERVRADEFWGVHGGSGDA